MPELPWIDATYSIHAGMPVWPGQPEVQVGALSVIESPGEAAVSSLRMSAHTGTHLDAPSHFIAGDDDITAFPLSLARGHVRVVEVPGPGHLGVADLVAYEGRTGPVVRDDRVFFRTRNSDCDWSRRSFSEGYAAVNPDLARGLVDRGVALVGVDYLSVAPFEDAATTHRLLLQARVWIAEGLNLRDVTEGIYNYVALPLKIIGSDASPLRVLVQPRTPLNPAEPAPRPA